MVLAEKPAVLLSVSGCVTTKHYVSCEFFVTRRNSPDHGISPPRNGRGRAAIGFTSQRGQSVADSALSEAVAKKLSWLSISSRPVRRIFAGLNPPLKRTRIEHNVRRAQRTATTLRKEKSHARLCCVQGRPDGLTTDHRP